MPDVCKGVARAEVCSAARAGVCQEETQAGGCHKRFEPAGNRYESN